LAPRPSSGDHQKMIIVSGVHQAEKPGQPTNRMTTQLPTDHPPTNCQCRRHDFAEFRSSHQHHWARPAVHEGCNHLPGSAGAPVFTGRSAEVAHAVPLPPTPIVAPGRGVWSNDSTGGIDSTARYLSSWTPSHPAPRTPHPAPRTPHPAPRTPRPAPRAPRPARRAPHPTPHSLHPCCSFGRGRGPPRPPCRRGAPLLSREARLGRKQALRRGGAEARPRCARGHVCGGGEGGWTRATGRLACIPDPSAPQSQPLAHAGDVCARIPPIRSDAPAPLPPSLALCAYHAPIPLPRPTPMPYACRGRPPPLRAPCGRRLPGGACGRCPRPACTSCTGARP
jgi:hypothetical protein